MCSDKTDVCHASSCITRHLSCLSSRHLSCPNSRHLSCLNGRHPSCLNRRQDGCRLSCLNSRHLSCLSSRHLSCPNSRHLATYKSLINAAAQSSDLERVEHWFRQAWYAGISLNLASYDTVLGACVRSSAPQWRIDEIVYWCRGDVGSDLDHERERWLSRLGAEAASTTREWRDLVERRGPSVQRLFGGWDPVAKKIFHSLQGLQKHLWQVFRPI